MARIPDKVVEEIRSRTNIVDIIGQYVELKKVGNNYQCSCPFHEDRNPSFSIKTDSNFFKCFSCNRAGDAFNFIKEIEGISYAEAIIKVAQMINYSLDGKYLHQHEDYQIANKPLYEILEKSANFYHYYLTKTNNGQEAYSYLMNRQLDQDLIDTFVIGFSPNDSNILIQYLLKDNYTQEQMINSGIFTLTDNRDLIDRFHGRMVFPLRDDAGKVIGFSGRVIENNNHVAKYINSPETTLFKKKHLLFNFDLAKNTIRKNKEVFVCEGFMDVMRLHQKGVHNAVATMGTSLTSTHLEKLSKVASQIVFMFDGDEAGQNAMNKAFQLSQSFLTAEFKAIIIPNKLDPDEWISSHNAVQLKQLLNQRVGRFDFYKQFYKKNLDLSDDVSIAKYIEQMIALIGQIASPIEKQLRVKDLSQEYGIDEKIIEEQIAINRMKASVQRSSNPIILDQSGEIKHFAKDLGGLGFDIQSVPAFEAEKQLIQNLVFYNEAWKFIKKQDQNFVFYHEQFQLIYFELIKAYYDQGYNVPLSFLSERMPASIVNLYNAIVYDYRPLGYNDQIMIDCIEKIEQAFLFKELEEWQARLHQYIKNKQMLDIEEAYNQVALITKKIRQKGEKNDR